MAESNAWSGASHTIRQIVVIPQSSPKKRSSERLRELWPDIRDMLRPRRRLLAIGLRADGNRPRLQPGLASFDEISDR